jgi:hypothetical protein
MIDQDSSLFMPVRSSASRRTLAFAQAEKGCSAMVETLKAATVIVALAELNKPAWVSQSTKKRVLRPDECTGRHACRPI